MKRFGSSDGWPERGDVLYDAEQEALRQVSHVGRDVVSLTPHLDESSEFDDGRRFDAEDIVQDVRGPNDRWELIAEPADDVRLNRSLLFSFIDAAPVSRPVEVGDELEMTSLTSQQQRSIIVHEWCQHEGALSERGARTVQYFYNLRESPLTASPEERVDEIGIAGFVKRANRYDKPVVLDAILAVLDRKVPEAEITAYRSDIAYISVDGRADRAAELLRHLHGHGFAAQFREDDRYQSGVNPTKLTIDTTVEPRTGDSAGASQSVTTNIHRV